VWESLQVPGENMVITPAIKGNSVSLHVEDAVEIQIPSFPTIGFEWKAQDLDTTILLQDGNAVNTEVSSPNSAGGIVTLIFEAVGVGKTTLNLLYVNLSSDEAASLSRNSFGMIFEMEEREYSCKKNRYCSVQCVCTMDY
jgi:predicted secreted protein